MTPTSAALIREALQNDDGPSLEDFCKTLIENRLLGSRDRWIRFADESCLSPLVSVVSSLEF